MSEYGKVNENLLEIIQCDDVEEFSKNVPNDKANKPISFGYCETTPLSYASSCNSRKIVEHLLENGANVNGKCDNEHSECALVAAMMAENWEIAVLLLEKGADCNVLNSSGDSPLSIAIEKDGLWAVPLPLFLRKGANVNLCGEDRMTPLTSAILDQDINTVSLLVQNGANVNVPVGNNKDVYTPLQAAVSTCNRDVIRILHNAGCNFERVVLSPSREGRKSWVDYKGVFTSCIGVEN